MLYLRNVKQSSHALLSLSQMFEHIPCSLSDLSWKFNENPFWLIDWPVRLDWPRLTRPTTPSRPSNCWLTDRQMYPPTDWWTNRDENIPKLDAGFTNGGGPCKPHMKKSNQHALQKTLLHLSFSTLMNLNFFFSSDKMFTSVSSLNFHHNNILVNVL